LFTDWINQQVLAVDPGGVPAILFIAPTTLWFLAVDSADRIFASGGDGHIYIYDSNGNLENDSFATGMGNGAPLAFGPGGALWGDDLYTINTSTGQLERHDGLGTSVEIGSGFLTQDRQSHSVLMGRSSYLALMKIAY
jgi:hypothetical protein